MFTSSLVSRFVPATVWGVLVTAAACSCNSKPAQVPNGTTSDTSSPIADAGGSGDAGDDQVSMPDATTDLTGSGPLDGLDGTDTAGPITPTSAAVCAANLPVPGQECSAKGEIKCTNVDADQGAGEGYSYCNRPHYVECKYGGDGVLKWTLQSCEDYLAQTEPAACKYYASCMIWGDVHRCQPVEGHRVSSPLKIGGIPCGHGHIGTCPTLAGQVKCDYDHIDACTRLTDLPSGVAADIKAQYDPQCSHFLDLGYYWFPTQACENLQVQCSCKKPSGQPPPAPQCAVPTVYPTVCFLDPATNSPACQKTCHDVGAYGY